MDSNSSVGIGVENASPEVQLEYYENQLMAFIVRDFEELRGQLLKLNADFFRNENYILFRLYERIASERGMVVDEEYLKVYLNAHRSEMRLDTDRIDFSAFSSDGVDGLDSVLLSTIEVFKGYLQPNAVVEDSFEITFNKFKQVYVTLDIRDTLQLANTALVTPIRAYRRNYVGAMGALEFMERKMQGSRSLLSDENTYKMDNASEIDFDSSDDTKPTFLADLDYLPTFNKAIRGLRTNTLITMVAPEKGMKTKMATRVAHTVMLNGHNVCFWGKEGGAVKVRAELRAIHYFYYYNTLHNSGGRVDAISSTDIMFGTLSDAIAERERISRDHLFKNPSYGSLFTPNYPFTYESLETVVREARESCNCPFMVIDYVQIMDSESIMDDRVVIEKAYSRLESLKGMLDMCIWCPAQMSTDAVQSLGSKRDREMRNITAKSTEPTKSADINFLLYVNESMGKHEAELHSLPSRFVPAFETLKIWKNTDSNEIYEVAVDNEHYVNHVLTTKDMEDAL